MDGVPSPTTRALDTAGVRATLGRYAATGFAWIAGAGVAFLVSDWMITSDGQTRHSVPDFLPAVPLVAMVATAPVGLAILRNAFRIWRVLASTSWSTLPTGGEWVVDLPMDYYGYAPRPRVVASQPRVLRDLTHPEGDPLFLATIPRTWKHFRAAELPVAMHLGERRAVVASPDFRHLAWASASPLIGSTHASRR